MPDDRQTKALTKLHYLQRLQALSAQQQAAQAQAAATAIGQQIAGLDRRVTAEAAALADYRDAAAMGRWADLMDHRRGGLLHRQAEAQQHADRLAIKAATARLTVEQHGELLRHLREQLRIEERRVATRKEWEIAAAKPGPDCDEP